MTEAKTIPGGTAKPSASFFQDILKPTLVLFLVGLIVTALLAWVYGITRPIIEAREAADLAASLSRVLPAAETFEPVKTAQTLATQGYAVPSTVTAVYPGSAGGPAGYAVAVSPKGYGGAISMLVGVGPDGAVTGVTILTMNETPGLGTNASKPDFLSQYAGLSVADAPAVVKTQTGRKGDVQALTGATVTSRAVTAGIADALAMAQTLIEKEG